MASEAISGGWSHHDVIIDRPTGGGDDGISLSLDEIYAFVRTVGRKATFMEIGLGCLEGDPASQGFNERFPIGN